MNTNSSSGLLDGDLTGNEVGGGISDRKLAHQLSALNNATMRAALGMQSDARDYLSSQQLLINWALRFTLLPDRYRTDYDSNIRARYLNREYIYTQNPVLASGCLEDTMYIVKHSSQPSWRRGICDSTIFNVSSFRCEGGTIFGRLVNIYTQQTTGQFISRIPSTRHNASDDLVGIGCAQLRKDLQSRKLLWEPEFVDDFVWLYINQNANPLDLTWEIGGRNIFPINLDNRLSALTIESADRSVVTTGQKSRLSGGRLPVRVSTLNPHCLSAELQAADRLFLLS